jgi:hypothetical protein
LPDHEFNEEEMALESLPRVQSVTG